MPSIYCLAVLAGLALQVAAAPQKRDLLTFDYIIVGGGTTGLVLANRLSANPNLQVAVVEAGTYYEVSNPLLSDTPAGDVIGCGSKESPNPLVDWQFQTQSIPGLGGRSIRYARGKCLGGSSARNFMIYQRGTKGSYQVWADTVGDQSWTFDAMEDHFKNSVTFTPPKSYRAANASAEYVASAFDNSKNGPLQVSYANQASAFSSYIEGSFNEIGISTRPDFNSGELLGAQYCASTINPANEKRSSSQTSFLDATKSRSNLRVFDNSLVKSIVFDSNKRATGIKATSASGIPIQLTATKEVILSAGAFQSPQLLMVSGIGPAAQLQAKGITPIVDLRGVGQNLVDHIFFGPTYRVNVETFTRLANDPGYILSQFAGPYQQQQGILTNPVCDFLGWEKVPDDQRSSFSAEVQSSLSSFPADWPELEYISAPGYVGDFSSLLMTQPNDGYQYATILATLVAPLSRGNVTLASADTSDLPLVQPNWLSDPADQAVAIAGYKRVRQAFASKYMAQTLTDKNEYYPGASVQTDEQILEVIRHDAMTVWHASGTCKMGKSGDASAVVDSNGKVFGVSGLRVADASIFPILPPGHPQSTLYAVGEKFAADILASD